MNNGSTDGWPAVYLKSRQIEADCNLPDGSVKPQTNGRYTLNLANLTEDQLKQLSHLWYVISHTQHLPEARHQRPQGHARP